ncbi:MAG TPA: hypothetical protein VGN16_09735 [Acidobacteriaceae bacterium]|jgi:hypothetical protein
MPKARITILPKPGSDPAPVELIESAIIDLAAGMKKLTATRLKRETIVVLLHEASNVGKPAIRAILNSMDQLEATFLKPKF